MTASLAPAAAGGPTAADRSAPPAVENARFLSLDALRGFSMFWLLGGAEIVRALTAGAADGSWAGRLRDQFAHVAWEGFRFYDFIFPLFLFCIGMSVPISIARRMARGHSRAAILRHAGIRLLWMIFFGWWVNGRLLTWDPSQMILSYSVLMMLGFGYIIAVVLVLFCRLRAQIAITAGVLLAYWALQTGVRVPGATGEFVAGGIFSDWLHDRTIGQLSAPWPSPYGRGWMITVWNHGATAMLGVFAYRVLVGATSARRALGWLVAGGALLFALGWIWSFHLPIVKNRWTSSYVLWCGGLSWLLLAAFHFLADVRGWRRWTALFVIIGSNSILAYLINAKFVRPFESVATILFGGSSRWMSEYSHTLLITTVTYALTWFLLGYMYRQRLFLRI